MKEQHSSSSRNEAWLGAQKKRNWLRWSTGLTLGLAVAAGVSIPLEEKSKQPIDEVSIITSTANGKINGVELFLENNTPTPPPQTRSKTTSSGEFQRTWNIDTKIPNQAPPDQSSIDLTESPGFTRSESPAAAQGSDSSSVGYGTSRTLPQQAMLESPQARAVARIPPARPLPTPIPTPPPIRSPQ